eukprot:TRINITY_DN4208_c0_g2_i2.p1 TRINITY_DN4208_c0_g2~~TRINITY_DN4208_c0_g2_i2.p1  ORF type:complete len:296 (+),score=75.65 TRINITY_DN4208_c0_g2_i2:56-943(+)
MNSSMKSSNHSHVKSRSTLKRTNNPSARNTLKAPSLKRQFETNTIKSRKKNVIRQIPATKIEISSLTTSRDSSTQPSNSQINRSFLLEGTSKLDQKAPTIRIEEECLAEGESYDAASYVSGRKPEAAKKSLIYKSRVSKLKRQNNELKMKVEMKEAELKKKDKKMEKERRAFKRIQDRVENFAAKFNKALARLESLCTAQSDVSTKNELSETNVDSSLVTLPNRGIDTSVTSEAFYSPKARDTLKSDATKAQKSAETVKSKSENNIQVQSSKKNIKLYKEMLRSLKTIPKSTKNP